MSEVDSVIVTGRMRTIEFAVCLDGTSPGKAFFESLAECDQAALKAAFQRLAELGESRAFSNNLRFKQERDVLFTFRHTARGTSSTAKSPGASRRKKRSDMIRLPCFRSGNRWIITHGFWKPPQPKWPEGEFTTAFDIMRQHLTREKKQGHRDEQHTY